MAHKWRYVRELYIGHPQWVAGLVGTALLVALTGVHALLGFAAGFNALYLLPIWLATRMGGRTTGFALVVLCTLVDAIAEWSTGHVPGESLAGDFAIRFVTFTALMLLIAQVEQALERQQRLAMRDPLTGLLNRGALAQFAEHAFNRSLLRHQPVTVAVIDCDGFKQLNDTYGHRAGDHVLTMLARELVDKTRQTDIVARIGGDEFAVVLQNTSLEEARQIMVRVDEAFVASVRRVGYIAGISIGYGTTGEGYNELDSVLELADQSMYQDKNEKKTKAFLN